MIEGRDADFRKSESQSLDAALCFFRALKVYPNSEELFQIYDKTVPKVCSLDSQFEWIDMLTLIQPILDILAEMIAYDPTMSLRPSKARPTAAEFDDDV
jgi:mitochondrial import receptor subunit TOM20